MRDDENVSPPEKKARRAFYPKLPDEVAWFDFLQKPRLEEQEEEGRRKNRDLAHFRNVVKTSISRAD
jgi:hypothetical protein